ncbi:DegT/DnrJ/EryC1/StrS family aminotransferase [Candidatus Micrarchaeota archaeon]|nr:DegT/DnrJ/EryC1/StrS family aminotransferase [Candidatus Micrarchaeota archaeon]
MKWKIPLYKIYHDEADTKIVTEVIERGTYWTNGPENTQLEKELSSYLGTKFVLTFANGTSALHAMLLAHGIGKADEVIVPSFTFISTANSVLFTGAKPVFADIENLTYGLDPEDVRKKITDKTKAIMPIHYGGCPAIKIRELAEIAEENDLLLLEDNAESLGAQINGKKTGSFGDSSMLSFCANKIITGGEGGAITTNSEEIYEKLKLLRSHGREEKENYFESNKTMDYVSLGYNYRMPTLIAALILSQLRKIDNIISLRREAADLYDNYLQDINVKHPPKNELIHHVYQMYTIEVTADTRDALMKYLEKQGIMSKVYFDPIHKTHFYKTVLNYNDKLSATENISDKVLTLPLFAGMHEEEIKIISGAIKNFMK